MDKKIKKTSKMPVKLQKTKVKKEENSEPKRRFDARPNLSKLCLYVTIVNVGIGDSIIRLMEQIGCSCQFVHIGTGTANDEVKKILNITTNQKELVFSFVRETKLEEIQTEVNAFFAANKKNKGIGFAIPLTTVMGIRVYKFLTQTI